MIILGRLSDDVVGILGPIGDFSVNKAFSSIPKIGIITNSLLQQITTNPQYENTSMIPDLTPKTELPTKQFKVIIDGKADAQNSVKSFKWLSNPKLSGQNQTAEPILIKPEQPKQVPVPDFVNSLPDLRQ